MAIVAVFSVYELAQYVHTIANGNSTYQQGTPLPSPDDDPDHDGLSNQQEVIWGSDPFNPDSDGDGFKDGEEVNSGHNPLIPGPADLINDDNLTNQISELTASAIYTGALNPDNSSYAQSLNDITSSVTDSGIYLFNKTIDASEFVTTKGDSSANLAHAKAVIPLVQQFNNTLGSQLSRVVSDLKIIENKGFNDQIKNYYTSQANIYATLIKSELSLTVPQPFAVAHADLVSLSQQMQAVSEAISHGDQDIVKASLAFDAAGAMIPKYLNFIGTFTDVLESEHVDMSLLNNLRLWENK